MLTSFTSLVTNVKSCLILVRGFPPSTWGLCEAPDWGWETGVEAWSRSLLDTGLDISPASDLVSACSFLLSFLLSFRQIKASPCVRSFHWQIWGTALNVSLCCVLVAFPLRRLHACLLTGCFQIPLSTVYLTAGPVRHRPLIPAGAGWRLSSRAA